MLFAKTLVAAAAASLSLSVAHADVYSIDFFPEQPQTHGLSQLTFVPTLVRPNLSGATITNTNVHISFTTGTVFGGGPFDAAGLRFIMTAQVNGNSPGYLFVTGADLGWSGQGTFTADFSTTDLNGVVGPGRWSFDLSGPFDDAEELLPYAGSFSADSRVDLMYTPPCRADFNEDGVRSVQDIFDFLTAYFSNDPAADIDGSGSVSVQDIFDYLSVYFVGCND